MPDGTVCQYEPPPSAQWVAWLTSCENAFGHTFLTIDRTGSAPQITTTFTQHLSSGQTREVVYAPGPGSTMTLTYGARTWVYTMANGKIVAVTPPDGPGWTFGYAEEFSDPAYPYLTHVITPGGGRIDYTYVDRYQMEHEIPPPPWPDGPVPPVYHGRFLDSRQVSGPDVTPGTWTVGDVLFHAWTDSVPIRLTVTSPSGDVSGFLNCPVEIHDWANHDGWFVGGGRGTCIQGTSLRGEEHIYMTPAVITYGAGMAIRRYAPREIRRGTCEAPQTNCLRHETHLTYDTLGNVTHVREFNETAPAVERITTFTYLNQHAADPSRNFVGLPTSRTVTLQGEAFTTTWGRNTATGFVETETRGGITTTFTPDTYGNIASVTTATGHTTHYGYSWGQVASMQTPEYTVTREINPDGTLKWEEVAGRRTFFEYDLLGRLKETQGPGGTVPIVTEYNNTTGRTVTTRRGQGRARRW